MVNACDINAASLIAFTPCVRALNGQSCACEKLNEGRTMNGKTPVWDIATRIWHWLMVLAIPAMWFTAENGYMGIHLTLGTILVGFLVFRLCWGIWGSSTSRFAGFIRGPKSILTYAQTLMKPGYTPHLGHNPLGGLSVIAILLAFTVQLGTGLFASDTDGLNYGPLSHLVDYDTSHLAADVHETAFNILLALIALHILAIAFYARIKNTNLVRPRITGHMEGNEKAGLKKPGLIALLVSLLISAGVIAYLNL